MTKFSLRMISPRRFTVAMLVMATSLLFAVPVAAWAEGAKLPSSGTDLTDQASLRRGAKLYMNYCAGCHSLEYVRYSRIGEDLGLTEDEVQRNLNFSGGNPGEQIHVALTEAEGTQFFGKMPPDLSVIARVRGPDWIYSYLKSFYLDETRPLGWNNALFPNASMPNPLWEMQGLQHAEFGKADANGDRPIERLQVAQPGTQTPAQFDQTVRDITAFLEYAGEPAALKRQRIGVWVVLFLALLTFLAWLLKKEYWRDVH